MAAAPPNAAALLQTARETLAARCRTLLYLARIETPCNPHVPYTPPPAVGSGGVHHNNPLGIEWRLQEKPISGVAWEKVAAVAGTGPDSNQTKPNQHAMLSHLDRRETTVAIFEESKGAPDYTRWRTQLVSYVASSGADFSAALTTQQTIPHAADYADASILLDTPDGLPALTLPQAPGCPASCPSERH